MQISSINSTYQNSKTVKNNNDNLSFQGAIIDKLTKPISPNSKVTLLDKLAFNHYLKFRHHYIGVTPKEFEALTKFEGAEFIDNSYKLLTKKLGLSKKTTPHLINEKLDENTRMAFIGQENSVIVDLTKDYSNKTEVFSSIRHELQHFLQHAMVYRHETKGLDLVNHYTKQAVEQQKLMHKEIIVKLPMEELRKMGIVNDNNYVMMNLIKEAYKNDDKKTLDVIYNMIQTAIHERYSTTRNNLIKEMGMIKKDSALNGTISTYYKEFTDISYYNKDGSVDLEKYIKCPIEIDSRNSEYAVGTEIEGNCGFKFIKDKIKSEYEKYEKELEKNKNH